MRLSDTLLGLLLLAGGIVLAYVAAGYPNLPNQGYGAATFPFVIGLGLAGLGAVMLALALRDGARRSEPLVALVEWGRSPASWARLVASVGLVLAYVWLAPTLGFLLAGTGLLLGLLVTFRAPPVTSLLVAPLATLVIAWAFGTLLRVPLPRSQVLAGWW